MWEYYAPDLPVVRRPDLEILDVAAVLDFAATGPTLQAVFAEETGRRGAWLVNWQDEVVDPNGVVPLQLELSGRETAQNAEFTGLTLRRCTGLRPYRFVTAPPIEVPADVTFGGQVSPRARHEVKDADRLPTANTL